MGNNTEGYLFAIMKRNQRNQMNNEICFFTDLSRLFFDIIRFFQYSLETCFDVLKLLIDSY